jgi:lipoate-protein ligase B
MNGAVRHERLTVKARGVVAYREALALQEDLVSRRAAGEIEDLLVLLEHPPVLTVGRGSAGNNVLADRATLAREGLEVVPVSRGGDVTWHGPGQLVGYPIVDLGGHGNDLHRFLRGIEEAIVRTLGRWGIAAARSEGRTGVWVGEEKIASIGIAVRRWVSYHGFALNVAPDLRHFDLIHPCGLHGVRMTSMARLLGERTPSMVEVRGAIAADLASALGYEGLRGSVVPPALEHSEPEGAVA